MPTPNSIAYLTSVYPRATDTFVRDEIAALSELGFEIHPFGVRRPEASQIVGPEIERELARTTYLIGRDRIAALTSALLTTSLRSPGKVFSALRLVFTTGAPGVAARLRQLAYFFEALLLARELERLGVHHLHNHIAENSAHVAMLASHLTGIPFSTTVHGMEILSARELSLGEKIERSAFTVCISEFTRSQCMMFTPHEMWPKLIVVRCGVGPQFLDAKPSELPSRFRFVCVGRISPEKGHLQLVSAGRRLVERDLDFEVVIVGDGPLRGELEQEIARAGLADRMRIAGWLDSAGVRREIEAASCLVVPSFSEGIPVAIMESLVLERPIVSSRVGGIPELVEEGRSGWLVTPGSVDEISAAMAKAICTPRAELVEMGRRGAARVRERHDARVEAQKLAARFRPDA